MDAVLVDLYDTLVWSEWPVLRERMAAAVGIGERDLMRAFVRTRPARGVGTYGSVEGDLRAVLRDVGVEASDALVAELVELQHRTLLDGGVHLYEDSLPALRALRDRGIATAVVSNCDHSTRPVVEALGLYAEVDAVVLSFEVGVLKPDPSIYRAALDRVGGSADQSVFVDDQPEYLDGAATLGMRTFQLVRPEEAGAALPDGHEVVDDLWGVVRAVSGP